jgi:serine/threonine protein kinase
MLTVEDKSILEDFERAEREEPSPIKVIDNARIIYGSRKLRLPNNSLWGQPVLCDFGEARIGRSHRGLIQPELYRAPEVLFDMEWSSSVDIWNVATLVSMSAKCDFLLLKLNNRFGICLRIGICSTRLMKA